MSPKNKLNPSEWLCDLCGDPADYHRMDEHEHVYLCTEHWDEHLNRSVYER